MSIFRLLTYPPFSKSSCGRLDSAPQIYSCVSILVAKLGAGRQEAAEEASGAAGSYLNVYFVSSRSVCPVR